MKHIATPEATLEAIRALSEGRVRIIPIIQPEPIAPVCPVPVKVKRTRAPNKGGTRMGNNALRTLVLYSLYPKKPQSVSQIATKHQLSNDSVRHMCRALHNEGLAKRHGPFRTKRTWQFTYTKAA